ncbi:hypothetical protein HMPREF1431_00416 [Helicobacter pylori GAMchJs106B]|nr:hypothetical protein HMPREF1431_00416 [Helicobacter pylori GAMchJs106B]
MLRLGFERTLYNPYFKNNLKSLSNHPIVGLTPLKTLKNLLEQALLLCLLCLF